MRHHYPNFGLFILLITLLVLPISALAFNKVNTQLDVLSEVDMREVEVPEIVIVEPSIVEYEEEDVEESTESSFSVQDASLAL